MKQIDIDMPWVEIKNDVRITCRPRKATTAGGEIYRLSDQPIIRNGIPLVIWAKYSDVGITNLPGPATTVIAPVSGTDYTGGSAVDLTDKTANITITVVTYATEAKITVENTDTADTYLTLFKLRGTLLVDPSTTKLTNEDATSQTNYQQQAFELDSLWMQEMVIAQCHANFACARLHEPTKATWCMIQERPDISLALDLFDLVHLEINALGIDGDYFLTYIEHTWRAGDALYSKLRFEPTPSTGYWTFTTQLGVTSILGW